MRVTSRLQGRVFGGWSALVPPDRPNVGPGRVQPPIVRPATSEDTPEILNLIATSYDRLNAPSRSEYWRWKHQDNPFGASPCLVSESNGRLVGVRVFLRWTWRSENRSVRTVRAVDTATLPEWRGKGIFSRLTMQLVEQMQAEGVSFIYNTPNGKSMPGYLKMGWAPVTRVPLWIRPLRLSSMFRALGGNPPTSPVLDALPTIAQVLGDPRLPSFLADVAYNDARYHTDRTPDYIRWRYADIPTMSYAARLETAGDAGALLVARGRVRGRLREVTISELLVTPSMRGMQLARDMVSDLLHGVDADYIAACAARGTTERTVLARAGFIPAPRLGPHFTARRLHSTGLDPARWPNWRCSIGDLEIF